MLLPLLGILLSALPVALTPTTLVGGLAVFVVFTAVVAAVRRSRVPPESRYQPFSFRWPLLPDADARLDTAIDVVLALSVLFAVSGMAFALVAPDDGQTYTDFALRTENESGELVASGYPTETTTGEPVELTVVVANREQEAVTYTVVVELQRVTDDGSVTEEVEQDRFEVALGQGETWQEAHQFAPTLVGDGLRLQYHLYRESPPPDGSEETAYRTLTLWIDVRDRGG